LARTLANAEDVRAECEARWAATGTTFPPPAASDGSTPTQGILKRNPMQSFTDNQGQVWNLSIDIAARKRVKEQTGVDLYKMIDAEEMAKLDDPEIAAAVIFCLCKEQVDKAGLTADQFFARFTGDVLDEAPKALINAIIDFFPSRRRSVLGAALAKGQEIQDQLATKMVEVIGSLNPPMMSKSSSTNSPESSELTRTLQI
jgi:hypothetical protein